MSTQNKPAARIIVFEGADDVGKTTIIQATRDRLRQLNIDAESIAFPGNEAGSIGEYIYKIYAGNATACTAAALQALHIAAHVDSVERRLRPLAGFSKIILLDRSWWSTLAYGLANGLDEQFLRLLVSAELCVWSDIRPNLVIVVSRRDRARQVAVEEAYRRLLPEIASVSELRELQNDQTIDEAVDKVLGFILDEKPRP